MKFFKCATITLGLSALIASAYVVKEGDTLWDLSDEYLHAEPIGHKGEADTCACHNDRCIATTEPVEQRTYTDADGIKRCYYCDHMI